MPSSAPPSRPASARLPHVLVLLDRWEGFTTTLGEAGGGALADVITQILAEGASAGIHLVMTGDRSLLAGRIAAMCEDKLVFKLAERDDEVGHATVTVADGLAHGAKSAWHSVTSTIGSWF